MGCRLWLDDYRKPPWGYDLWAKTAQEAIEMLQAHDVEHCSLDHDLAEEHYGSDSSPGYGEYPPPIDRSRYKELTGYAVLEWMNEHGRWVADISIHTLNDTAGAEMLKKIRENAPAHVQFRRVKPWAVKGV